MQYSNDSSASKSYYNKETNCRSCFLRWTRYGRSELANYGSKATQIVMSRILSKMDC